MCFRNCLIDRPIARYQSGLPPQASANCQTGKVDKETADNVGDYHAHKQVRTILQLCSSEDDPRQNYDGSESGQNESHCAPPTLKVGVFCEQAKGEKNQQADNESNGRTYGGDEN
jgi:hypothetical protein